jgi:hypothetical protein
MRVYAAEHRSIEVKGSEQGPEQFVWRDRLYRVQRILQQWDTSTVWWQDIATTPTGADRRIWRVEASPGRCAQTGVYDVGFDPASGRWSMLRVLD